MPDYTKWAVPQDVQEYLSAAGLTLRPAGVKRIPQILRAVIRQVEQTTLRQFVPSAADETRYFNGSGTPEQEIDEIVSLTSVQVIGAQSAPGYPLAGAVVVKELNKPQTRLITARGSLPAFVSEGIIVPVSFVFPAGRFNIAVTGIFGYGPEIPADLWEAVCGEVAHRLGRESLFQPQGRVVEKMEGDVRKKWQVTGVDTTGWHDEYTSLIKFYKRPGRSFRNLFPDMI